MSTAIEDFSEHDFEVQLEDLISIFIDYTATALSTNITALLPFYEQDRMQELLELIRNSFNDYAALNAKISVDEYRTKYEDKFGKETIRQLSQFIENGLHASNKDKYSWGYTVGQNLGAAYGRSQLVDYLKTVNNPPES